MAAGYARSDRLNLDMVSPRTTSSRRRMKPAGRCFKLARLSSCDALGPSTTRATRAHRRGRGHRGTDHRASRPCARSVGSVLTTSVDGSDPASQSATGALALRRLRADEIPAAAELLAAAFDDDPTAARFRDPRSRRRVLQALAGATLRDADRHGQVHAAWSDDRLLGVVVWYPPFRHPPSLARVVRTFVPAGLRLAAIDPMTAVGALPSLLRDGRRWAPPDAWYLQAVAVERESRARGIGVALVSAGLTEADRRGEACYLRTSHQATIPWYGRMGFEVLDEPAQVDSSQRIRMRRPAAVSAG
jgi:ribosomal protein S18 acetylase RimI-like enzyme